MKYVIEEDERAGLSESKSFDCCSIECALCWRLIAPGPVRTSVVCTFVYGPDTWCAYATCTRYVSADGDLRLACVSADIVREQSLARGSESAVDE